MTVSFRFLRKGSKKICCLKRPAHCFLSFCHIFATMTHILQGGENEKQRTFFGQLVFGVLWMLRFDVVKQICEPDILFSCSLRTHFR